MNNEWWRTYYITNTPATGCSSGFSQRQLASGACCLRVWHLKTMTRSRSAAAINGYQNISWMWELSQQYQIATNARKFFLYERHIFLSLWRIESALRGFWRLCDTSTPKHHYGNQQQTNKNCTVTTCQFYDAKCGHVHTSSVNPSPVRVFFQSFNMHGSPP